MLRRLLIENFELVERADITFSRGSTIFTGETGSGKSMILGALSFVLGARSSGDRVGRFAARAAVSITFDPARDLRARLSDDGFGIDDDEDAVLAREVSDGKSSFRLNGRATAAAYVRELASSVAEIVGQHDAQRLLVASDHTDVLDRFGGDAVARAREEVAGAFASLARCKDELAAMHDDDRRARERYEEAFDLVATIDRVAPQTDEDERLSQRRRVLDNVEHVATALQTALDALRDEESGAGASLGSAHAALAHVAHLGDEFSAMAERLVVLQAETAELTQALAREVERTEYDPAELDSINARLAALEELKRRFGPSLVDVGDRRAEAAQLVDAYESRTERERDAVAACERAQATFDDCARRLTGLRSAAAAQLSAEVEAEFADLALAGARFVCEIIGGAASATGVESIRFLFSAHAGEAPKPLTRVASGGELSRLLLALSVVTARTQRQDAAMIFDEIDAGIGGATASAVGVRLASLARASQVVCVTHLAQVAAWAQRQYALEKSEDAEGVSIGVRLLDDDEQRARELARMLSGESHDVAIVHARALMESSRATR